MKPVENYKDFMNPLKRKNLHPDGFDFDMDTFENLIDFFTPMENIPVILRCDYKTLDNFCKICYNMPFKDTYIYLSGISDALMRGTFKKLAAMGNTQAVKIVSEHFMNLKENKSHDVNITIVNDLKDDEED